MLQNTLILHSQEAVRIMLHAHKKQSATPKSGIADLFIHLSIFIYQANLCRNQRNVSHLT